MPKASSRVLALWLPHWSVERARRRLGRTPPAPADRSAAPYRAHAEALLLAAPDHGRLVVARCCPLAARHGVVPGLGLAEARALLPAQAVRVADFDEADDLRALRALAGWALRFAPAVALDPPDGLLLDVTGCTRLFGSERAQEDAVVTALERLGVTARACVAGTIGCARAVARHGGGDRAIVPAGEERAVLAPLPVRALRVESETTEALAEVGVESVGDLLALARDEVAARFGEGPLLRVDQALGEAPEPFEPEPPRVDRFVERAFDGPVTSLEAVLAAARALLGDLTERLRRERRGVLALDLTLRRADASALTLVRELSRPTADAVHLWALLRPSVERAHLGFGLDGLVLRARRTAALRPAQTAWAGEGSVEADEAERATAEMLDTLAARFGAERILKAELVASHLPESAVRLVRACEEPATVPGSVERARGDRPSLLLDRPEPLDVAVDEATALPVEVLRQGRREAVTCARGPERLASRWWEPARGALHGPPEEARDYFALCVGPGRWLWAYRSLPAGRWWLHGEWA